MTTHTPDTRRIYHVNYIAKPANRAKLSVRAKCAAAIKTGKLIRLPCETCDEPKSEAHHEDYSKPFDVKWLCRSCHQALHRAERKSPRVIKTHCQRGHAMTGHNVIVYSREGYAPKRKCRQCHNDASNRSRSKPDK